MKTYPVKDVVTILRDDLILAALPKKVLKQLGDREETGFNLSSGRRDIFMTNGTVRYILGGSSIDAELD